MTIAAFLDQIHHANSIEMMASLPAKSVDVVFADPPYNLRLRGELWRPNQTKVDAVNDDWDQVWDHYDETAADYSEYDAFTRDWLRAVQRVLKDKSSLWVSGTYHNIFRVGAIMQDLGYWVLNTITWYKPNGMPNFNGTRFKNDVEFIIWAKKSEKSRYHFNYQLMKRFNDGKQLGAFWTIPICAGPERLLDADGKKLHSTQKPEELLRRILLASGKPGAVVLDPFSGSGTTAAVAKELHMRWIGIEQEALYIEPSRQRVAAKRPLPPDDALLREFAQEKPPRVAFAELVRAGYLCAGQALYLGQYEAVVQPDGSLQHNGKRGSIHKLGKELTQAPSCNGWTHWHYRDEAGTLRSIDTLREKFREERYGMGEG